MIDFEDIEFENRTLNTQKLMKENNLDAILLTTEAEFRYYSGFRTPFWQSPTRNWYLIIPRDSDPIAIIPEIGFELMKRTWIKDIRVWSSPGPEDETMPLLFNLLSDFSYIGLPIGLETSLRMPLNLLNQLVKDCQFELKDCTDIIKHIRMIKSYSEIKIIKKICNIASDAFHELPNIIKEGKPFSDLFREFRIELLNKGANEVPYLVGGLGKNGYKDIISPPTNKLIQNEDMIMLDTGSTLNGYFCDFDRNFSIGNADSNAKKTYENLWMATELALKHARAGVTSSELFEVMAKYLEIHQSNVGRFGHGLGIQLTEWPSIAPHDHTVLKPNMVITLEPSLSITNETMMVHEENILITEDLPILLSERAPRSLTII